MFSLVAAAKEYQERVAEAEKAYKEAKNRWQSLFGHGYKATEEEIQTAQDEMILAEIVFQAAKKGL